MNWVDRNVDQMGGMLCCVLVEVCYLFCSSRRSLGYSSNVLGFFSNLDYPN